MVLTHPDSAVVTGAFSYTGRYVARHLIDRGVGVRTLTRDPGRADPFGGLVGATPLDFSDPAGLRRSIEGASVLYNTYWVRFGWGLTTFDQAVQNARILFEAAARADVGRMVRFSVANASPESRLTYFRGKGLVEEILKDTGIPYAIISPTPVFGQGDLPLNNMDWRCGVFRSSPFSGAVIIQCSPFMLRTRRWMPGHGLRVLYSMPPVRRRSSSRHCCACWPRRWAARLVGANAASLGFAMTRLVGLLLHDVVLSRDEVDGLMAGLLASAEPPTGTTRLSSWLKENGKDLGRQYVSELRRNYRL